MRRDNGAAVGNVYSFRRRRNLGVLAPKALAVYRAGDPGKGNGLNEVVDRPRSIRADQNLPRVPGRTVEKRQIRLELVENRADPHHVAISGLRGDTQSAGSVAESAVAEINAAPGEGSSAPCHVQARLGRHDSVPRGVRGA